MVTVAGDGTEREIFILTEARYTHSCALAFQPVLAGVSSFVPLA